MYVVIDIVGGGQLLSAGTYHFLFFFVFDLQLGHGITKLDPQPLLNKGVSTTTN